MPELPPSISTATITIQPIPIESRMPVTAKLSSPSLSTTRFTTGPAVGGRGVRRPCRGCSAA